MTNIKTVDLAEAENNQQAEVVTADVDSTEIKEEQMDLRFKVALNEVLGRYPKLAEDIRKSLHTPQMGEHHQEGPRMDSHLKLILENLRRIVAQDFPDQLDSVPGIKKILAEVVMAGSVAGKENIVLSPRLVDYAFLHDLEKPNSMSLKLEGRKDKPEITWEQWQEIEKRGEPYVYVDKDGNETAITGIAYMQASLGKEGTHGFKAAQKIREVAPEVPKLIAEAINKHEVAYQFSRVNAATYEEHFVKPGFSEEEQRFILTASYIDTMSSLKRGEDGQLRPDLSNYIFLVRSRANYLLIKQALDNGLKFRENDLNNKKKSDKDLTYAELEAVALKEEDKKTLDLAGFQERLAVLLAAGAITEDEKSLVLSSLAKSEAEFNGLGKQLRAKFKLIKSAYNDSMK